MDNIPARALPKCMLGRQLRQKNVLIYKGNEDRNYKLKHLLKSGSDLLSLLIKPAIVKLQKVIPKIKKTCKGKCKPAMEMGMGGIHQLQKSKATHLPLQ